MRGATGYGAFAGHGSKGMGTAFAMPRPQAKLANDAEEGLSDGGDLFKRSHGHLNFLGLCMSIVLPWLVFVLVAGGLSFSAHFKHPGLCVIFVFAVPLVTMLLVGALAHSRWRGNRGQAPVSTWLAFIAVTAVLCWLVGVIFGFCNYHSHMLPFYSVASLHTYPAVDPATMKGQQLMDAGVLLLDGGSRLDLTKAVGFKSGSMYCAAPIVPMGGPQLGSYDFWAVGVDCCSEGDEPTSFWHCGDWRTTRGGGGVRWMNQDQQKFFRLAVQEAETEFHLQAIHPLFFEWSADPVSTLHVHADRGLSHFLLACFCILAVQLFLAMTWAFVVPRRWQK